MAKTTTAQTVTVDDLSEQIATLKSDIATLTSTMGDLGKAKTHEATQSAKDTVDHLATASRERALDAQKQAEEFVRTQPSTALGLAAGIGFLAGLIMARR